MERMPRGAAVLAALATLALAPAVASARDATVTSFDGTKIGLHFFPAAGLKAGSRVPTVLEGPGWGGRGITDTSDPQVSALRHHGYNVLTWDPRGVGDSTGQAEVDSPAYEARDVSALIDFTARQPEARLDRAGDPRVGMVGGSYGGGIQLVTAAIDHRVDAIVPTIAWHSLVTSLAPNDTAKTGWTSLLLTASTIAGMRLDPNITAADAQSRTSGDIAPKYRRFFAKRGPGDKLIGQIKAPTMIVQGTIDTLFPLAEGIANYKVLRAHHVPVKMVWYCGGHGLCLTPEGNADRPLNDTLLWLRRYLNPNTSVKTGPGFEWVDQRGHQFHASHWPLPARKPLTASGSGRLPIQAKGGSGPFTGKLKGALAGAGSALGGVVATKASNAVNVRIRAKRAALVMGAPKLRFTYQGTAPSGSGRIVAQVVDNRTGLVLGNQPTPDRLRLDGKRHTTTLLLATVTATARQGQRFTVQLTSQSALFDLHPKGGSIRFTQVKASLPTVKKP